MAFHSAEYMILEKLSGRCVLELGCGSGHTAAELVKIFENPIGVEPDTNTLLDEDAKRQYSENENFTVLSGDGTGLPFKDCAFEGIISHWSLHHYRYPQTVLLEARRVLENNGWLYLADGINCGDIDITEQQQNHLRFHAVAVAADRFIRRDHFPLRTPEGTKKIVQNAGFKIKESKIVFEEDPNDPRREQEYIDKYIANLSAMGKKLTMMNAPNKLIDDVNSLIESIEIAGIRMAPFIMIVAEKRNGNQI